MYRLTNKGERVREMFNAIAPRYDLLNRLLSLGIDKKWRRFAVKQIRVAPGGRVLDVATGTADVALEIAATTPESVTITGIDFSPQMIELGLGKVNRSPFSKRISLQVAPCESIPFDDNSFDSATIAFGIRNVVDRNCGLKEILRVLKPHGRLVILEFSNPRSKTFKTLYNCYFLKILPVIGGLVSNFSAYKYLPDSVLEFPPQEEFQKIMTDAGFQRVTHKDLTFGIATVYSGEKPAVG